MTTSIIATTISAVKAWTISISFFIASIPSVSS